MVMKPCSIHHPSLTRARKRYIHIMIAHERKCPDGRPIMISKYRDMLTSIDNEPCSCYHEGGAGGDRRLTKRGYSRIVGADS